MARRAARSKTVSVDFTGVEGRIDIPEGEYLVKVEEVTQEDGDKAKYLAWKFEIAEGDSEGGKLYLNTSLSPAALWNLKTLLEALGEEVPDDEMDLDLEEMADKELIVTVEHETWEGKKRAKIVDFHAAEEEEVTPKARTRGKGKTDEEEEAEDNGSRKSRKGKAKARAGVTEQEIEDMDEDELEALINEHDLDLDLGKFKTLSKKRAAVLEAAEEAKILD